MIGSGQEFREADKGFGSGGGGSSSALSEFAAAGIGEPTDEEEEKMLAYLDEMEAAAERIIASLDNTHRHFQEAIRETRTTREILAASNEAARTNAA